MTLPDLPEIPLPDDVARADAARRLSQLDLPGAGFGALAEPIGWAAAVRGEASPRPFQAIRAVLLAGDHSGGVAAGSAPDTHARAGAELAGAGPIARLAARIHARVDVVDVAIQGPPLAADVTTRIRDGAATIEETDACTEAEAVAGFTAGRVLAESLADSGTDLIVLGSLGTGTTGAAAAVASFMTGVEPAALLPPVVGPDGVVNDRAWMLRCVAVRDALARVRRRTRDPLVALAALAGPDIAAATGLLAGAAARRTPVLLDGPVGLVAALLARDLAGQVPHWCLVPDASRHPTTATLASRIGLQSYADLRLDLGEGAAALTAAGLLQTALDLACSLPTVKPSADDAVPDEPSGSDPR